MAKVFRFRLEVVERVRAQSVDKQRRVVADAVRALTTAEQRVANVTDELRDLALQTRDAKQAVVLDVGSLRGQQFYRGWLADQAIKAEAEAGERRQGLALERNRLAEASKRLKVIERLRERQWERFRVEQNRREQVDLDEVAIQVFRHASSHDAVGVGA